MDEDDSSGVVLNENGGVASINNGLTWFMVLLVNGDETVLMVVERV